MERFTGRTSLVLISLMGSILLIIPFLSVSGVFQVSEGREGVVVEAMRDSGELILPLRHGSIVPSKPPLFHWIGLATERLTGTYREFELRFPSALAAISLCVLTSLFAFRVAGFRAGLLATGFLLTSWSYLRLAADGRVDMVFTFFTVWALIYWGTSFLQGLQEGRVVPPARTVVITSILCGIAALAKGPLGFALVGLVALAAAVWEKKWQGFRGIATWHWFIGVLIPLPWYVAAALQGQSSFVARQIIFENLSRFTGAEGITPKPFYYYLTEFWSHNAPWSVPFAVAAALWIRDRYRRRSEPRTAEDSALLFTLLWIVVMIAFFSLSVGKRRAYLLPTIPAMALFLSIYLNARWDALGERWFAESRDRLRRSIPPICFAVAGISAAVMLVPLLFTLLGIRFEGSAGKVLAALGVVMHREWWRLLPAGLLCLLIAYRSGRLGTQRRSLALHAVAAFFYLQFLSLSVCNALLAIKGETHSYRELARQVREAVPAGAPLAFIKRPAEESFDGFFFYLSRNVPLHSPAEPPTSGGTFLARRSWLAQQSPDFLSRVKERLVGGRIADEPGEEAVLFDVTSAPAGEVPAAAAPPAPAEPTGPLPAPSTAALEPTRAADAQPSADEPRDETELAPAEEDTPEAEPSAVMN